MTYQSEQKLVSLALDMTDLQQKQIGPWSLCHRERPRRSQGRLTSLFHDERGEIMNNEPFEVEEAAEFAAKCSGHVLVLGLGIGMIVRMLKSLPQVDQIYVIESEREVLDLIGPSVCSDRVKLYHANAYDNDAPKNLFGDRKFDAIWMDIWDNAEAETYTLRLLANGIWSDRADLVGIWALMRSEANYHAQK